MSKSIRVLQRDHSQVDAQLIAEAGAVVQGLTGRAIFAMPPVDLKTLQAAVDELSAAATAQVRGGTAATAVKRSKRAAVIALLAVDPAGRKFGLIGARDGWLEVAEVWRLRSRNTHCTVFARKQCVDDTHAGFDSDCRETAALAFVCYAKIALFLGQFGEDGADSIASSNFCRTHCVSGPASGRGSQIFLWTGCRSTDVFVCVEPRNRKFVCNHSCSGAWIHRAGQYRRAVYRSIAAALGTASF